MYMETDSRHTIQLASLPPCQESINEINRRTSERRVIFDKTYQEFTAMLLDMYPYCTKDDLFNYEIMNIDFYLGDIYCLYETSNHTLYNHVYSLNDSLRDISTMDLTLDNLKDIREVLNAIYFDITGLKFDDTLNRVDLNEVICSIHNITEAIIAEISQENLISALRQLYAIIDFCLTEDTKHSFAREARLVYLTALDQYYSYIHKCDARIDEIKREMNEVEVQNDVTFTTSQPADNPSNQKPHILQSVILAISSALIFYLAYGIIFFLHSLVILALASVPIIERIMLFLLNQWDAYLDGLVIMASCYYSSIIVLGFLSKFAKNEKTASLGLRIVAIVLFSLNVLFLFVNLVTSQSIYINACMIIASVTLYLYGNK